MLYRHHPGVQFYKQALELTQGMGPDQQCKIALRFDENTDHRRYNLPTTTSNEIAVILPGDGDQPTSAQDIVLHRHGGGCWKWQEKPPTSHRDSLVLVAGAVVIGNGKKSHQQVVVTHWWWWLVSLLLEMEYKPPTSHKDSLVMMVGVAIHRHCRGLRPVHVA